MLSRSLDLLIKLTSNTVVRLLLYRAGIQVGSRLRVDILPRFHQAPHSTIILGHDVHIYSSFRGNKAGVRSRTCISTVRENSRLHIGDHVGISGSIICCSREIVLENHVKIGCNCLILDSDLHPLDAELRKADRDDLVFAKPVIIGENSWIGANATILKGVRIGKNVIVGAGSVVTKSVEDDCIVAGNPARVINPKSL